MALSGPPVSSPYACVTIKLPDLEAELVDFVGGKQGHDGISNPQQPERPMPDGIRTWCQTVSKATKEKYLALYIQVNGGFSVDSGFKSFPHNSKGHCCKCNPESVLHEASLSSARRKEKATKLHAHSLVLPKFWSPRERVKVCSARP